MTLSVLQGLSVLVFVLGVFLLSRALGHSDDETRALTFTTLVIANLGLMLTNRSWNRTIVATLREPNAALWWVVAGAAVLLGAVLAVPPLRSLFRFAPMSALGTGIAVLVGLGSILWFEALKLIVRFRRR